MTTLVPVDPTNTVAVTDYLTRARDWLSRAVEETGPEQIAAAKAEIATAAEATKQLGLSKDIQEDSTEMVRRAEWTLRRSVNQAQERGEVATRAANLIPGGPAAGTPASRSSSDLPGARDFFAGKQEYEDANAMAELDPADFDAVIEEAKAEGNLSRANVARKARERTTRAPAPKRAPLTDSARNAGWDLRKAADRLERIATDDRFAANKDQVAPLLRSHLEKAVEVCQDLLARIDN